MTELPTLIIDFLLLVLPTYPFYRLAKKHGKSDVGYALLGFVSLFLPSFLYEMIYNFENDEGNNFIGILVGILSCVLLYYYLKKRWEKQGVNVLEQEDILDL